MLVRWKLKSNEQIGATNDLPNLLKIPHSVLPVKFAHLVNPLDKEKSTFPHMVGVKHPKH